VTTSGPPGFPQLPPGSMVGLPAKGDMFVRDQPGPADRPTLLLLHGLTSTADLSWFSVFPQLEGVHRALAPDLRGHGDGLPADRMRLETMADDMSVLIDVLGLTSVIVAGYSMGGIVAQLLWRRRPEIVSALILCATCDDFRQRDLWGRAALLGRRLVREAALIAPESFRRRLDARIGSVGAFRTIGGEPGPLQNWAECQLRRSPPLGVMAATVALRVATTSEWVSTIDVPTAVVVPVRDSVVPPSRQRLLGRRIGAEVIEIEGEHGVFVEDPATFASGFGRALEHIHGRLP
jgi:3-oxoadipate enol-lactonase